MRNYFTFFLLLFCIQCVLAQSGVGIKDEAIKITKAKIEFVSADSVIGWKRFGFTSLNFSQISLSNWAAGGLGSVSLMGTFNYNINYRRRRLAWDNLFNVNYGIIKQTDQVLQKNEDRIEVMSSAGYKAFGEFYYTGLASFKTQIDATFNESKMVSNFMAPAFLQTALGMTYKQSADFSMLLAPVSGKFTFVSQQKMADAGEFGVSPAILDPITGAVITPGKNTRLELGAYFLLLWKKDIMENVRLSTRLDLFNNYTDPVTHNRKNIDINWETLITMKINKYISSSLFTHLIYDQDIPVNLNKADDPTATGPRTQFKQVLGVGFGYKF